MPKAVARALMAIFLFAIGTFLFHVGSLPPRHSVSALSSPFSSSSPSPKTTQSIPSPVPSIAPTSNPPTSIHTDALVPSVSSALSPSKGSKTPSSQADSLPSSAARLGLSPRPIMEPRRRLLSLVAVLKGEVRSVREWVVYHHLCGVDHFYLYNNDLDQHLVATSLHSFVVLGLVTLVDYSGEVPPVQSKAYAHFVVTYRKETRWVAFLDLDEYFVPMRTDNLTSPYTLLPEFLNSLNRSVTAICVHWRMFGSSHLRTRPQHSSVVASFLMASHAANPVNQHVKTIAKARALVDGIVRVHDVKVTYGIAADTYGHGQPEYFAISNTTGPDGFEHILRINHYHVKSHEEFHEKIRRGRATVNESRSDEYMLRVRDSYNDEVNVDIVRFLLHMLSGEDTWKQHAASVLLSGADGSILSSEAALQQAVASLPST